MLAQRLESYGRWVVRQRTGITLLIVVLTAAALLGITRRLEAGAPVDFTPQAMFMGEGGEWERLQSYEAEFGAEDNTIVALLEGPIDSPAGLRLLRELQEAAAPAAGVEDVDSLITASIAERDDSGMIAIESAIPENQSLQRAATDPFLSPLLISPQATAATLQIHLNDGLQQIADLSPVVEDVSKRLRSVELGPDFTLHLTGVPFVRAEVVELMLENQVVFFPLVTAMFTVTIIVLFRRFWLGLAPLVGVLIATVWTMGMLLSQGAVLNILSVLTPTLVLVIGVADGIHLVSRYREELARDGCTEEAMGRTTRQIALACFLTTFTTASGFATLLVADTAVIRDFGAQVAVGVMITFFAVMLVVPCLLAWIPAHAVGTPDDVFERPIYTRLARYVTTYPRRVFVVALAVTMLVGWLGRSVRTDSGLLEMYHEGHPTWTAVHSAQDLVGGVIPVFIHLSGEPDQMLEPEILAKIDALETSFRRHDLVGYTVSPAGWVKHFHKLLTGENGWPSSRAAVTQELLLAEMSGELPLDKVLSSDGARARILAITKDAGGREFLAVKAALETEAQRLFKDTGIAVDITGDGMLASSGVDQLITDLLYSLGLMLIVILLTMMVLLRDWRQTLIATLPNLVPLVFILGTLGVLGADLQTSNIVTFTIAVGLAVDDTIHFIVRYREERQRGIDTTSAIHRTFQGAGHAIVLTSILLICGFGILTFSSLTSTYFFGLLACVTMTAALVGDLLILPALLQMFDKTQT